MELFDGELRRLFLGERALGLRLALAPTESAGAMSYFGRRGAGDGDRAAEE